jgi:uncharacterized protein (DUF2336 family)
MATVSSFEGMTQPTRNDLKQFAELFEPIFKASSLEARRNATAALARCPIVPKSVAWFLGTQPISIAAIFLTRSAAIDDDTLIAIARSQGLDHARAIAARENLSVKVVDALVALHDGQVIGRNSEEKQAPAAEAPRRPASREEEIRQQLKALVKRDTLAGEQEGPEHADAVQQALLVRFARQRNARDFSDCLARRIGSSRWLTNRILLDLSGQQLATALIATGVEREDGVFILKCFYPHLIVNEGGMSRADAVWSHLDAEECRDRLTVWIRADNYTQYGAPEDAANANDRTAAGIAARPAFAHARGGLRR